MGIRNGTGAAPAPPGDEQPLPDLLELDLAELGTIEHPVLREVLGDLRARAAEPSETLWDFDNSF
ncbi:FxSxx-COOH cyclophane-containing RiPP peptide [Streptomyces olivaceus]|uniref:FxSxx-COOH cyclophane-containing RiPP peptide n=1 Tax=Streptomyces olivaceus TaxID=47716 RepID=UPI001CCE9AED|nr:FxSxx-COOH cyclophane-containing RiPP peptide [Streptomyces olivaceus]MBZ6080226.1 FXSXX-COOH protein [Streptomyces olivaceus]